MTPLALALKKRISKIPVEFAPPVESNELPTNSIQETEKSAAADPSYNAVETHHNGSSDLEGTLEAVETDEDTLPSGLPKKADGGNGSDTNILLDAGSQILETTAMESSPDTLPEVMSRVTSDDTATDDAGVPQDSGKDQATPIQTGQTMILGKNSLSSITPLSQKVSDTSMRSSSSKESKKSAPKQKLTSEEDSADVDINSIGFDIPAIASHPATLSDTTNDSEGVGKHPAGASVSGALEEDQEGEFKSVDSPIIPAQGLTSSGREITMPGNHDGISTIEYENSKDPWVSTTDATLVPVTVRSDDPDADIVEDPYPPKAALVTSEFVLAAKDKHVEDLTKVLKTPQEGMTRAQRDLYRKHLRDFTTHYLDMSNYQQNSELHYNKTLLGLVFDMVAPETPSLETILPLLVILSRHYSTLGKNDGQEPRVSKVVVVLNEYMGSAKIVAQAIRALVNFAEINAQQICESEGLDAISMIFNQHSFDDQIFGSLTLLLRNLTVRGKGI